MKSESLEGLIRTLDAFFVPGGLFRFVKSLETKEDQKTFEEIYKDVSKFDKFLFKNYPAFMSGLGEIVKGVGYISIIAYSYQQLAN